jgi:hypothetical protein
LGAWPFPKVRVIMSPLLGSANFGVASNDILQDLERSNRRLGHQLEMFWKTSDLEPAIRCLLEVGPKWFQRVIEGLEDYSVETT